MEILLILLLQDTGFGLSAKDIVTYIGLASGFLWGTIQFILSRKHKVNDDSRDESRKLLEDYKAELKNWKLDYDTLSDKYEKLYTDKMGIQIELAVIAYEHELLYSKLKPEEQELVRARVSIFKDNLTSIAVKEKEIKDKSTAS